MSDPATPQNLNSKPSNERKSACIFLALLGVGIFFSFMASAALN